MTPPISRLCGLALPCFAAAIALGSIDLQSQQLGKPMSFHNRLLLNRLAVNGHQTLEVLVLTSPDGFDTALTRLEQLKGRASRAEREIGYIRGNVALEKLIEWVHTPGIEAYQIVSLSKGGWYRDAVPQENADNFRRWEGIPIVPATPPSASTYPPMSVEVAHSINRAADADVGIDEWLAQYPMYDGRGVTIALIESAEAEFTHPAFQSAKALDGTDIPKFAGILNTIDLDEPDRTRLELMTEIVALNSRHLVGTRTYLLPKSGSYRFGLFTLPAGGNLFYEFGVLRDLESGEVWVDTDGDTDFEEETPIPLSENGIHTQQFSISKPREAKVSFAVTTGRTSRHLNIYASRDEHQTMTASVAAGNRSNVSLAYGVAPGARVLLVRHSSDSYGFRAILETYIDTMRRPDVDIVCTSTAIDTVATSSADFVPRLMTRLIATYKKPIIHGAGNSGVRVNSIEAVGDDFSVGGATSPATFAALYGGGTLDATAVDARASAGPTLDGSLKPDFVAPMLRIAGGLLRGNLFDRPTSTANVQPPIGYDVSCCTSATSPYAAGVVALLLSAAKQARLPYSVPTLRRALYASARAMPGWQSYQQGAGLLDVRGAWTELQRVREFPVIVTSAPSKHALSLYVPTETGGPGLFEREGWRAGMMGERELTFRRLTGAVGPQPFGLSWSGNDGTFETVSSITLPSVQPVSLPLRIHPKSSGAHSALLNLHEAVTGAIVLRTQVMVAASEPVDKASHVIRLAGSLPLFGAKDYFVSVPPDTQAMHLDLHVRKGRVAVAVVRSDTVQRGYYFHLDPSTTRYFPVGRHSLTLPLPTAGVWSFTVTNSSAVREWDRESASAEAVVYELNVQLLSSQLNAHLASADTLAVDARNLGAAVAEAALETSIGTLRTHEGRTSPDGLPSQIAIDVPADTSTLTLHLRGTDTPPEPLDLHLYDCTSGECFSYDFTLPPGPSQSLIVRAPKAGRWVAAVNSAPAPAQNGGFVLDEILTTGTVRHRVSGAQPPGATWRELVHLPAAPARTPSATTAIALVELFDAAVERDDRAHPWENREAVLPNLAKRPVAIGSTIVRRP